MPQSFFHESLQFARLFTKKLNEQLASVGLYHSQWAIVYYLKQVGSSTLVEISQYLNVEKPTVSRTVDRLEKSQYVEKIPSEDKRERRIQLTEKGNQVFAEAIKVVDAFERKLVEEISPSDLERTQRTIQHIRKKLT